MGFFSSFCVLYKFPLLQFVPLLALPLKSSVPFWIPSYLFDATLMPPSFLCAMTFWSPSLFVFFVPRLACYHLPLWRFFFITSLAGAGVLARRYFFFPFLSISVFFLSGVFLEFPLYSSM